MSGTKRGFVILGISDHPDWDELGPSNAAPTIETYVQQVESRNGATVLSELR